MCLMVILDDYGCERSDAKVEKTMYHTLVYMRKLFKF